MSHSEDPSAPAPAAAIRVRAATPGGVADQPQRPVRPAKAARPEIIPTEPRAWAEVALPEGLVTDIVLRSMNGRGALTGQVLANELALALHLLREVMEHLKEAKLVEYKGTTRLGDFLFDLTSAGRDAAARATQRCAYIGTLPVPWSDFIAAVEHQSLRHMTATPDDMRRAFADLTLAEDTLERLGPAINSGSALFLFGEPGNGKTSLAERMTRCYGDAIWLPRTLLVHGQIVSLFDPALHHERPLEDSPEALRVDRRWVRIDRPTVVAGGELTLDMLDLAVDATTQIAEAPMQLKASCGTLLIDDFGRGATRPQELLNRWIFPLEKGFDFLKLPDGRKFAAPFDCLLVFSTNLEPRDLTDEAFLRRIPYKIYVSDPDADEFQTLVERIAERMNVTLTRGSVKYLIERHYKMPNRPMRYCHPRDLITQICNRADFLGIERSAGPTEWDHVIASYFGAGG